MTTSELEAIFNEYRMFVFYYCIKIIGKREDAEDITSQVFLSLWEYADPSAINKIKPYLATMAHNKCIDFTRRESRQVPTINTPVIEDMTEDLSDIEITNEVLSHIYSIMESLPPLQKLFIKMKYIEGNEPGQIAKILNRNVYTIRNQMVHALTKIRKELKNRGITLG